MLALATDENFNDAILRGLQRRCPELNIVRVQDVGLAATPDLDILAWAATEGRILLTHDRSTMPTHVHTRAQAGLPTHGVFIVSDQMGIGRAIDEILLAAECLTTEECASITKFFPL